MSIGCRPPRARTGPTSEPPFRRVRFYAARLRRHIGDILRGKLSLTLAPLRNGQWLAVRPDGHYRGSPGVEKEIVYIVQTAAGQELLASDEFAKKYGWKNDPERMRLPCRTAPEDTAESTAGTRNTTQIKWK